MPETYAGDPAEPDVGLSLDLIAEEIERGLPTHVPRLVACYDNEEYYRGRNAAYLRPREGEDWISFQKRPKRTSKLTRKVIRELAKDLYNPGPTRKLEAAAAADAWLQEVYAANHVNAIMQQGDRKATLNGLSAVQCVATGRPEKPVQLYLWGAHELVWWTYPDDPTAVWAVVCIHRETQILNSARGFEERVRLEAWTRDEHRVFRTRWAPAATCGTVTYATSAYSRIFGNQAEYVPDLSGMPEGTGINPYGCLPFTFLHDELPVSQFDEGGIGCMLRECNAEVDRELTDLATHTREFMDPDRFLRNVASSFRREKAVDRWQPLPPTPGAAQGDNTLEPDAFLVQGNLAVDQVWMDITSYANHTFEELDVPLIVVRDDASTDLSGVAIVAKQLPLLSRTRARQQPFAVAEDELAKMVLTAAGNFYGDPTLLGAAPEPRLSLVWPEPTFPLPTAERDAQDDADLASGRKSLVQITAERMGTTRDQAKEHLEQVLDDNIWYADLLESKGLAPEPEPTPPEQPPTEFDEQGNPIPPEPAPGEPAPGEPPPEPEPGP